MFRGSESPPLPLPDLDWHLLFAVALAMWFAYVSPANAQFAKWSATFTPLVWTQIRDRWEYTHATDAGLMFFGLSLLLASVLVETSDLMMRLLCHSENLMPIIPKVRLL